MVCGRPHAFEDRRSQGLPVAPLVEGIRLQVVRMEKPGEPSEDLGNTGLSAQIARSGVKRLPMCLCVQFLDIFIVHTYCMCLDCENKDQQRQGW